MTWNDHAEAAELREALVDRDVEDVLLVSELHAAAALAQTVGRAVGYDKTALMFVERETATLAVVETVDGSVVKVLSRSLCAADAIAVVAEMVTSLQVQESIARGMFVVGSGVDVTAVKAHLQDLVSVPVIAPEEPQLALARGAALASANAPRYDTSTIGLAYSQDPDGTTVYPFFLADDATTFLGHADATEDTADIASDPDDVPERSKPFLVAGSSLATIFVAGMMALTIALVVNVRPTADQDSDDIAVHPGAAAPPPALQDAPPEVAQQLPNTAPAPAPAAPPPAVTATAQLKARPAAAAASGGAQRSARPRRATTRTGPTAAARCASTGDTAGSPPVAATDCSATPLLQPGSEEAAVGPRRWRPRRPRRRAWARRR